MLLTKQRIKKINYGLNTKPPEYNNSGGFLMPKINAGNTKGLLAAYIIKIIASSLLSVLTLSSLFSLILLKLDLDLKITVYISVFICVISSIIISVISISGFKNNFLVLSAISVIPLAFYSIIDFCVNKSGSFIIEIIKLALIFLCAIIVAVIKSARKSR